MNSHLTKTEHMSALRFKYYFLATLLTLCISLLSVNVVVAEARNPKNKTVRANSSYYSPKSQCKMLKKNKNKGPKMRKSSASKRRMPKAKRMAESG